MDTCVSNEHVVPLDFKACDPIFLRAYMLQPDFLSECDRSGRNYMKGVIAALAGLGLGAGLMYLLDPDRGNRRRALIRDKMTRLNRQTQETISGRAKDISNRAKGLLHEAKSVFETESDASTQQSPQQPTSF